jgi:hypothetical protein
MKKLSARVLVFLFVFSGNAFSAQVAIVDTDNTPLLDGPQKKANVIQKLKKDVRLDISNYPTEGFYKARTRDHVIGWVSADSLDLQKSPNSDSGSSSDEAPQE